MKKIVTLVALCFALLFGGSVFAFSDIKGNPAEKEILALKEAGIISGVGGHKFAPEAKLDYAAGVHLIVKTLGLNINAHLTTKKIVASEFFTEVPDDAWYAYSFIVAQMNGLDVPKDVDPAQKLTRELFTQLLFQGIMAKGDFSFVKMAAVIDDSSEINPTYLDAIQKLVISKVASLEERKFYPRRVITRGESAAMLYKGAEFVKAHEAASGGGGAVPGNPEPVSDGVAVETVKVNDKVNKVVLTWGEKPNAGYRIRIPKIEFFETRAEAVIYYELLRPVPGKMYAEVITKPQAEVYLSAKYKPVLKKVKEGSGEGQPPKTMTLTYNFDGHKETEKASYWEGQNGYYIYVPERLTAEQVEPGIDVLTTTEIPHGTMQIEALKGKLHIGNMKAGVKAELKQRYPAAEPTDVDVGNDPFFEHTHFAMAASDDNTTTTVYVLSIDGKPFKITLHIWKSETWSVDVFQTVMKTIGLK